MTKSIWLARPRPVSVVLKSADQVAPGDRWTVISLKPDETVYSGIGTVEMLRERAAG